MLLIAIEGKPAGARVIYVNGTNGDGALWAFNEDVSVRKYGLLILQSGLGHRSAQATQPPTSCHKALAYLGSKSEAAD